MGRAGLVPLGSQSHVWYGDAPVSVPNPGTALSRARRGGRRTEEGLVGAVMDVISSSQPRTMMSVPRSTGMGLPGQGISAGWRHQIVLQPSQAASLAGKEQTG